jgi:hypothetical protein
MFSIFLNIGFSQIISDSPNRTFNIGINETIDIAENNEYKILNKILNIKYDL